MNKRCARCEKTVYPIEELKCLDKVWHKLCFKCQICNMTLNMRNYKGFDKQPYCEAHIPKAKATTMAETPELKRIAENTKIQSNAVYHAEFERAKGKFTQVADDPETLRIKQNTKIISNAAYHGDLEKKAIMEQKRFLDGEGGSDAEDLSPTGGVNHHHMPPPPLPQGPPPLEQPTNRVTQLNRPPGRIADYDPMADKPRNSPYSARQSSTVIYTSDRGPVANPPTRRVGSIADLDPVNDFYGSLTADYKAAPHHHPVAPHHPLNSHPHHNNHHNHVAPPPTNHQQPQHKQPTPISGRVYRAMYDYDAQDSDEVSFHDGDVIVNCTPIDEGWMTGMIQRTGQSGMLPANYVEPAN